MNLMVQQGWQCPCCSKVYSPTTSMCFYCPPKVTVASNLTPKRTWVGLTDEEIAKIILDEFGSVSPPHGFSQDSMVEAFKLGAAHGIKEKNT